VKLIAEPWFPWRPHPAVHDTITLPDSGRPMGAVTVAFWPDGTPRENFYEEMAVYPGDVIVTPDDDRTKVVFVECVE
jgi:hypothetical protein